MLAPARSPASRTPPAADRPTPAQRSRGCGPGRARRGCGRPARPSRAPRRQTARARARRRDRACLSPVRRPARRAASTGQEAGTPAAPQVRDYRAPAQSVQPADHVSPASGRIRPSMNQHDRRRIGGTRYLIRNLEDVCPEGCHAAGLLRPSDPARRPDSPRCCLDQPAVLARGIVAPAAGSQSSGRCSCAGRR